MAGFTIIQARSRVELQHARAIFREYGESIADVAASSLQHQDFDGELDTLPGRYAEPRGVILLAYGEGPGGSAAEAALLEREAPVACAALRPLPDFGPGVCELKRMYVKPVARGHGLGRLLGERIITAAAGIGYTLMKLDTSASMVAAQRLYHSLGFVPCAAYNDDPDQETLWFERVLRPEDAGT